MKQQYRHTQAPESIDRHVKKRGGKDKPFRIVSDGIGFLRRIGSDKWVKTPSVTLGRYETRARAEQALPALVRRGWANCTIVEF